MNRIEECAIRYKERMATISQEDLDKLQAELDLSFREIATYQQEKSLAQLEGVISLEEATTIYNALNRWDTTPLQTKVAVTLSMGEILKRRLGK